MGNWNPQCGDDFRKNLMLIFLDLLEVVIVMVSEQLVKAKTHRVTGVCSPYAPCSVDSGSRRDFAVLARNPTKDTR